MVITDEYLRAYALKIYKNVPGYTLTKVFTLFPKYAGVIMSYYEEFASSDKKQQLQEIGLYVTIDTMVQFRQLKSQWEAQKMAISARYTKDHDEITDLFKNCELHMKELTEEQRQKIRLGINYNYKSLLLNRLYDDCELDLITLKTFIDFTNNSYELLGEDIARTLYKGLDDVFKPDIYSNIQSIEMFDKKSVDPRLQLEAATYITALNNIIKTLPERIF